MAEPTFPDLLKQVADAPLTQITEEQKAAVLRRISRADAAEPVEVARFTSAI